VCEVGVESGVWASQARRVSRLVFDAEAHKSTHRNIDTSTHKRTHTTHVREAGGELGYDGQSSGTYERVMKG